MITNSPSETQQLAGKILSKLKDRNIVCLYGELGAGKTTFVQGLAKALGIEKRVISPTFILLREYEVASRQLPVARRKNNWKLVAGNWKHLLHLDCYRIDSEEDFKSIDLKELWQDKNNLVVIEWTERIAKILPKERIDIKFEYISENEREITMVTSSQSPVARQ